MGMATAEAQFHVLAVDDSILDRKLIEKLLKTSSYQVTAVDSGSKALEFLGLLNEGDHQTNSDNIIEVNLIITDYCMPGMTGYDLLRTIKESASFKDIPVVIMSSEDVPSRINRCLEGGAEEFFLKPVQLSDVNKLKPHLMKGRSKEINVNDEYEPNTHNNNKRKGMAEIINSSDHRTRTKYTNNILIIFLFLFFSFYFVVQAALTEI